MTVQHAFTNRLSEETSPYLRQHAHNPVDWYPWGAAAIEEARRQDKPIFLSIGYSACHWCHVMEHESFEDPEIGAILKDKFISIKVDREERPDLDQIYMAAVQLMTRSGGWPMSVFLTPALKPFYGGTYFPPDSRYGRPSFRQVLHAVTDAWQNKRDAIDEQAGELTRQVEQFGQIESATGELSEDIIRAAVRNLSRVFDVTYGGFGSAPKFPHGMDVRLLLRAWRRFNSKDALEMACKTLDGMAMGGIYDHLGGGFHRYSTDQRWLAPHFEKMLYDNALLTCAYLEGYQATGSEFYRTVVEETLAYVEREMIGPEGPFFSTQDADSEGEEGKFFVWSEEEIKSVLGDELSDLFCGVYNVVPEGNWEGKNILHLTRGVAQDAKMLQMDETELRVRLAEAKKKLFAVRSQRIKPARDEKILTSWNGLMIDAFALAAQVLDNPKFAAVAERAADFVWARMRRDDGRLLRTCSAGSAPKLNAYLEDYTFLLNSFVSLYEATFNSRWINRAVQLTDVLFDQFWDEDDGGFFYTGRDHEQLITRTKDPHDSSIPSGNSMAATALLRLAKLTGSAAMLDRAKRTLHCFSGMLVKGSHAAGQMLNALDFYLGPVDEIAIVGDLEESETNEVLRIFRRRFHPHQVLAFKPADSDDSELTGLIPLLQNKAPTAAVATYICRDFACQAPLVGLASVQEALAVSE